MVVRELTNVHKSIPSRENLHEGAKVHQPYYLPSVDVTNFHLAGQVLDHGDGFVRRRGV